MTAAPTLCETRAPAGADPTLKRGLRPCPTSFPGRAHRRARMCYAPPPLPPPPGFFFFFFPPPTPSSPRSPVVFPGRFCLAGDPFPRLCGRRGPPESWPCSPLRRPRARLLAPPEAAAPGARAAGRERCLRRHLREREPGCANRLARPARRGGALLANREAKLSPCRTGRKC